MTFLNLYLNITRLVPPGKYFGKLQVLMVQLKHVMRVC